MQDKDLFPTGPMDLPGEQSQPTSPRTKPPRRFSLNLVLLILLGIVLAAGAVFGAWYFLKGDSKTPATSQDNSKNSTNTAGNTTLPTDVPATGELRTFKSDHPRISFTYPEGWTATEADQGVRITSSEFTYKSAAGKNVTGHFRLYIRQGARPVDSPYIGSGLAIKPSEKLVYTEPAPGQRSETNLMHFGQDATDHFSFFFIAGNYTLAINETLGPDYGKEPETYIIAGGYSSNDLTDDLAMNQVPLDYYDKTIAYRQAMGILASLKLL